MRFDVIIVGGGIIGCSTAFFLSRRGMRVAIVEPGAIGGGTTSNSFAWANASTKTGDAAYHRLNADGLQGYRTLMAEFGASALGVNPAGALQITRQSDAPGHRAMLDDAAALDRFGYPCHLLDHKSLCRLEPNLRFAADTEALHLPADMVIDAPRFTRFIAGQVVDRGGTIIADRAETLIADDDGVVSGVVVAGQPVHAASVVLAAGPDTAQVLADLTGYDGFTARFPMRKVPGFLMTTPPLSPGLLRHLLYTSTTNELHMLPAPNGGLKIGSDDVDALVYQDQSPDAMRRAALALLARAEILIPGLADCVEPDACQTGIGVRPYPEDGRSIAGPLPGAQGLYLIATHSGITLAPVLGALMAEYLATGEPPAQLTPFALNRFPGFTA